ncbi:MAG: cyclic nucleotide-binding domain-containing protein [Desulfobacterales bacterium]|nr:cyclic nucleotide-binding domain-containing protein [Desulfobacterales bacterium]
MAVTLDHKNYVNLIKKNVLFRYMSEEAFFAFLDESELMEFEDGEIIISQNDVSQFLYCLIKGSVAISVHEKGDDFFIYNLEEGEIFGEAAIFLTELRIANVKSSGASLIIRIHRKNLINFIGEYSQAGNRIFIMLIYSLLKKLRASTREITAVKKLYREVQKMKEQMEKLLQEL